MIYGAPMLGLPGWQCRCPRAESWNTAASVYCDGCDTHAPRADPLRMRRGTVQGGPMTMTTPEKRCTCPCGCCLVLQRNVSKAWTRCQPCRQGGHRVQRPTVVPKVEVGR